MADRVLENYRKASGARPLPTSGSIRIRLAPLDGTGLPGSREVEWEGTRYRETTTSSGVSSVRGIQAGKAFFTDEDGVTRVGSEPMLAELVTRSYFWRRAYLFDDRERARIELGPADDATESLVLRPRGGNPLRLVFDRKTDVLRAAISPRFRLEFETPARFHDFSRLPVGGEVLWTGLPTRRLPDPSVGGWRARFDQAPAETPLLGDVDGVAVAASVSNVESRLAIDADTAGPIVISPELARKAGLKGERDAFGRLLAGTVTLRIGSLTMPAVHAEIADPGPGLDASAGGALFRETVVEVDPVARRLRLHDPEQFAPPEAFQRNALDDDGDVPTAVLYRSGRRLRWRAGTRDPAGVSVPPSVAKELGLEAPGAALSGLVWGTLRLPPVPARIVDGRFDPDWGDDGAIGWPLLSRFHVFLDMPHRWIYLRPAARDHP